MARGGLAGHQQAARGGNALPPLPLPLPGVGPALASGTARVERTVAVDEGVYRVTVVMEDAAARTTRNGPRATASTRTSMTASVGDQFGGQTPQVVGGDFAAVPREARDHRLSFTTVIDEPSALFVVANLSATSQTAGRTSSATATAASGARIVVTPVG